MLDSAVFVGLGFFLLTSGLIASFILMVISRNKQLDGFMLLSGSDTLATVATGLLLLLTHFKIGENDDSSMECNNEHLAMHLSIFILPMITTLGSMPSWFLQMYYYSQKRCHDKGSNNYTNKKRALSVIALQWLMPLMMVLPIFKTEPVVMKMRLDNNTDWRENSIISINMGETYCWDQVDEIKVPRSVRIKQLGKFDNISDLTSYIVERVYKIVEQKSLDSNRTDYETNSSTNDMTVYIKSINNALKEGLNETDLSDKSNNILNKHNSTVYHASNIGNMLTKTLSRLPATRDENNLSTTNLDEIIVNFLAGMHKSQNENKKQSIELLQSKPNIIELMENVLQANKLSNLTINTTHCMNICYPSRTFLKKLFFGLLFLSLFIPVSASIILQAKTKSKIDESESKSDVPDNRTVLRLRRAFSLLVKTAVASGVMVSPSLIESSVRSLLSNEIPQCLSKLLFILAQVGMIIRNVAGLQMVKMTCDNKLGSRDDTKVHPETIDTESTHQIEQLPNTSSVTSKQKTKDLENIK
ncbi:uncharacterized protein LOC111046545 [Nilaparvata lugens]|uniref:uncharacterized protein LOC111046545 n=1 Tax=Nilaparvata lugens TaxID=108931 RepID=UPI00193E43AE|nr:uncharacterized protein LOC111046545 [Nilaparvata lugens]